MITGKNSWKCFLVLFVLLIIAVGTLIFACTSEYKPGPYFGVAGFLVQCYWIVDLYRKWSN